VVEGYPNRKEALQFAGLDFEVCKMPNIHRTADGTEIVSKTSFFTYRADNNDILGDRVGADYQVVQNVDAFSFFDSIVGGDLPTGQAGGIMYETAGALGKGERIFITAKLPDYIRVGSDDVIEKYLFLTTSHDGSGSITAAFTPVRVVCQNTLNAALGNCSNVVKIRHTASAQDRLKEAHKVMGIANRLTDELDAIFNLWSKVRITDKEVMQLVRQALAPSREVLNTVIKGGELSTVFDNICNNTFVYAMSSPTHQTDHQRHFVWRVQCRNGLFPERKGIQKRGSQAAIYPVWYGTASHTSCIQVVRTIRQTWQ
jgi:phage/plasmid-like protein (TIGR03299 family)